MKINRYLDSSMSFGYYNKTVLEDMERISSMIDINELNNKSFLITGATGMLATYCVYFLCYIKKQYNADIKVFANCRNKAKADRLFSEFYDEEWFNIVIQDVCENFNISDNIDYILHLASNASPYYIKNDPVGIIKGNIIGTLNILEFSKAKKTEKILFASTREVYGKNEEKEYLSEDDYGIVNPLEDRACYPESKRAAETILKAYQLQYNIPFNTVRIAHSYGPGMNLKDDGRVMADLMCNAVSGDNIVLKSDGTAERAFCYITDAVSAMFIVLLKGKEAKAYNIANEKEPVSIKELASMLVGFSGTEVIFDIPAKQSNAYCNYKRSGLDTSELESLGWSPKISLVEGLRLTYNSFKE